MMYYMESRTNRSLLPFQRNIPHADMRPQFVLAVAAILQSLAQPAAGFAVAVAVHVADAGAGTHQVIVRAPDRDSYVAHAQLQIFVACNAGDSEIADLFVYVEVGGLRDFKLNIELGVSTGWSVELDSGVAAADFEVHKRVFQMTFTPGLDGVVHADL